MYRQWVTDFPDSAGARAEREGETEFAGRPDQVNGRRRRAVLRHDPADLTIPISVDGKTDDYLFDTGAWQSVMTTRRAARLGLKLDATRRALTGSSGQSAGIPILLALDAIRWSPDGAVEIGAPPPDRQADPNLVFDRNHLLLRTRVFGRDVLTTFDTGASSTDLNATSPPRFRKWFRSRRRGRQTSLAAARNRRRLLCWKRRGGPSEVGSRLHDRFFDDDVAADPSLTRLDP